MRSIRTDHSCFRTGFRHPLRYGYLIVQYTKKIKEIDNVICPIFPLVTIYIIEGRIFTIYASGSNFIFVNGILLTGINIEIKPAILNEIET